MLFCEIICTTFHLDNEVVLIRIALQVFIANHKKWWDGIGKGGGVFLKAAEICFVLQVQVNMHVWQLGD